MPPAETWVLEALRSQADRLTWLEGKDGEWARVTIDDARKETLASDMKSTLFDSILRVLAIKKLYREIDSQRGWVNMGELPPRE